MFVEKKYPGCRAIGERVDEIENHRGEHAHAGENHCRDEHEKFQHIAAIRTKNFPETAARFGNDRMVALQHRLVHRKVADAAEKNNKNIHDLNISEFVAIVIWSEK